jgi:peroxiredoxin
MENKGKIVVVNVFATWCAPCVTEVPDFVRAHTTYPEDKLAMLGVSIDEDKRELANFIVEQNISYPVYRVGEEFTMKYHIEVIPQTYVHAQNGKLYKRFDGMITFEELQEIIEHLLASSPESEGM